MTGDAGQAAAILTEEKHLLDGLINLYKPRGLTSAKALYRVRKITGQRKSGHAGTLDPLAEGVLILCLGRATKLVESLMEWPKVYRTTARLDVTSETLDVDSPVQVVPVTRVPDEAELWAALRRFEGRIEQVPPAVSALKVGGVPAYKLARVGKPPKLAPRPVEVHWIHLHGYVWPEVDLEVACGRGTYVRALLRDVGEALGVGGCLTALTRTAVGPLEARQGVTLAALEEMEAPEEAVWPLEAVQERSRCPIIPPPRPYS